MSRILELYRSQLFFVLVCVCVLGGKLCCAKHFTPNGKQVFTEASSLCEVIFVPDI